jgi:hypothetical protein
LAHAIIHCLLILEFMIKFQAIKFRFDLKII